MPADKLQKLMRDLPDPESSERFFIHFSRDFPLDAKKLLKDEGLLSDVLALASFSPLLATTLLQNPAYIFWLKRQRGSQKQREKEEMLESLARFAMTNSEIDTNVLLARFRRRELLRIYLRDIRELGTVAEITEEISNLADAVLEYALRIATHELDNRYGSPFQTDLNERAVRSSICIVALGKLGSKELNYASDIDLLFLYSCEGATAAKGKQTITNREYFVKLAQSVTKIVGGQGGEGAAYRVDSRLRPHGRVGALAISLNDAENYYKNTARAWEKQVLIRSRAAAGDPAIFEQFIDSVSSDIFSVDESVENALRNARNSKEMIDSEKFATGGFDVKLGKGGIREIEFIAQALQIAYGGSDEWIRSPHTLISLNRLADRKLLSENELTTLYEGYTFLRRLEHHLQMENGLQTHLVPDDDHRRAKVARKMNFSDLTEFDHQLEQHSSAVSRIFIRIFGNETSEPQQTSEDFEVERIEPTNSATESETISDINESRSFRSVLSSLRKFRTDRELTSESSDLLRAFCRVSPHYAAMIAANPGLIEEFGDESPDFANYDFKSRLLDSVNSERDFSRKLSVLRRTWSALMLKIAELDVFEKLGISEIKKIQTKLAEASLEAALAITKTELEKRFSFHLKEFPFAVLGLGKLGGGGMDHGSDLDLVLIFDDSVPLSIGKLTFAEFYSRAVEIFVTALSSLTRDGLLYRVDLRLRPDGKNGATSLSRTSFLNYLETRSAMWEWLAYVKLRGVGGDMSLAKSTENSARAIIHKLALESDQNELRKETLRVRNRLENERSAGRKGKDIDIKYGEGGMLDVFFAVRYLQLRDNVSDREFNRSTIDSLANLKANGSMSAEDFRNFSNGYEFISRLDHNLRLIVGRSTLLPAANQKALETIVQRLKLNSIEDLHENLTIHRLNIRSSFENILKDPNVTL